MFRAACSSRKTVVAPLRSPYLSVFSRSLSEDTKQEIAQRLLQEKPVTHIDELTYKKRDQWEAAIGGFLPLAKRADFEGRNVFTHLPPGQHLLYCNTKVSTEQLLPDGTDTAFSPLSPWSSRLWAGGRIRFPQPHQLGIVESPRVVLVEYVRDVRMTGTEGQEKIFVKIERRVGKLHADRPSRVGHQVARTLKRKTEDEIGNSLIVETRDLCFLRETGSTVPFERRHITPPTNPDYSHSLTPTPALLFRFSALTYNAHAIHIDPEYTRNVYGFPNLLVHGPLSLALMLEYVRQILFKISGQYHNGPGVTEINYRNLAPLFANEEMTICVKKKRHVESAQSSPTTQVTAEPDKEPTDGASPPPAPKDDSVMSSGDEIHESEDVSPPRTISTESGVDIGKGFPTPPSGEDDPLPSEQEDYSEPKFKPSMTVPSGAGAASDKGNYPQEWEVWIQTGQGVEASLAVRGTVKIEAFDRANGIPTKVSRAEDAKLNQSTLTKEETEMLQKVKSMLEMKTGGGGHANSQPRSKKKNHKSPTLATADVSAESTTGSEEASPTIIKTLTNKPRKLIHYHNARDFSTHIKPVSIRPLHLKDAPVRKVSLVTIRPHNSKVAHDVARGVNMYNVRLVESQDGVKRILVRGADADDTTVEEMLSDHHDAGSVGGSKIAISAEGAFERTLRVMLEEK